MAQVLLKEIPILPSEFKLDIIICRSLQSVAKLANKRYGATIEWYMENLHLDCCCTINSRKTSDLKGCIRTVVVLEYKKVHILAHELVHALWHLAELIGYEMTYESQEWQAVMYEYMFSEAMKNDYTKVAS